MKWCEAVIAGVVDPRTVLDGSRCRDGPVNWAELFVPQIGQGIFASGGNDIRVRPLRQQRLEHIILVRTLECCSKDRLNIITAVRAVNSCPVPWADRYCSEACGLVVGAVQ